MVEFGNCANRAPAGGGVAVFTRDRQWTVRTPGSLLLRESRWSQAREGEEHHEQENELVALERNCPLTLERTAPWVQHSSLVSILNAKKRETTVRWASCWPRPRTGQMGSLP